MRDLFNGRASGNGIRTRSPGEPYRTLLRLTSTSRRPRGERAAERSRNPESLQRRASEQVKRNRVILRNFGRQIPEIENFVQSAPILGLLQIGRRPATSSIKRRLALLLPDAPYRGLKPPGVVEFELPTAVVACKIKCRPPLSLSSLPTGPQRGGGGLINQP